MVQQLFKFRGLVALTALISISGTAGSRSSSGGKYADIYFKSLGIQAVQLVRQNGIQEIEGVELALIEQKLRGAKIKINNDITGARNKRNLIEFNALEFMDSNIPVESKVQLAIHETLGLMDQDIQTYKVSYAFMEKFKAVAKTMSANSWGLVEKDEGNFPSYSLAMHACRSRAKVYQDQYGLINCEVLYRVEKVTYEWTEIVMEEKLVKVLKDTYTSFEGDFGGGGLFGGSEGSYGSAFAGGGGGFASAAGGVFSSAFGLLLPSASFGFEHEVTRKPVIVKVPKQFNMKEDRNLITYGYQLVVSKPLMENTGPSQKLYDSLDDGFVTYATVREAMVECTSYVLELKDLGYEVSCERPRSTVHPVSGEAGFSYSVVGKKKFIERKGN